MIEALRNRNFHQRDGNHARETIESARNKIYVFRIDSCHRLTED